jgi:hypothetical protein
MRTFHACGVCLIVALATLTPSMGHGSSLEIHAAPPPRPPATGPLSGLMLKDGIDSSFLHQPPSLSLRGTPAVTPFLGLGYGRGTTTDTSGNMFRGTLQQQTNIQEERVFHDILGKSIAPNEFQLGIRLPF